ncbi:MAG TPA: hypothetical protein VGS07_05960 [Thermoanaerobaculia bacterium]|jgi:hypothetical protein|nr:hypothetical protein [Thermoanaerobaculia bacterium]
MKPLRFLALLGLAAVAALPVAAQQVTVVDMTPKSMSSESNDDSEPNLAIDPATPSNMAASAFTPDPNQTAKGSIYLSIDGGMTWTLKPVLPASVGVCINAFCDITLRFAGTSGRLYLSTLTSDANNNVTYLLNRFDNIFVGPAAPVLIHKIAGMFPDTPDQPYIQATTVLGGDGVAQDRVFVGLNDARTVSAPRTATVDVNLNAGAATPAASVPRQVDAGMPSTPPGRDGSSIRTAIHPQGVIYAAFYSPLSTGSANIMVVRDDHWGAGASPFTDLKTASTPGVAVVSATPYSANEALLGGQKVGRSQISIAVDPNKAGSVWLAWGDASGTAPITLHLRHSTDGGATWGSSDLRAVSSATNPAVAVNSTGQVGFLYQQFKPISGTDGFFLTQVDLSNDEFATPPTTLVLSAAQNDKILNAKNQIGDYDHMMAVGKDFFGVFSADNAPDKSNFPNVDKLVFQREHDAHALYPDSNHTFPVGRSVDSFFFHLAMVTPDNDFFVRDWTDGSGHDLGLEPSTHPVFYTSSDVWNELTNVSGSPSAANAPVPSDPQPGANFAFVRVGRKAIPGAADVPVTAHFLYSDFGAGMAYTNAIGGTPPILTFQATDNELTLPDGQGYEWTLPATHSSHICMAVEIESPLDPFAKPDLNLNVPGWPTLDTAVLYDNNKAQRNIIYPPMKSGSKAHYYALVRNAAPTPRSVCLRLDSPADAMSRLGTVQIDACGLATTAYRSGATVCLPGMAAGEVRALSVTLAPPAKFLGQEPPLAFTEVTVPGAAGKPRDGFAFAPLVTTVESAARGNLVFQAAVFGRLAALYNDSLAASLAAKTRGLLQSSTISAAQYATFLKGQGPYLSRLTTLVPRSTSTCAPTPGGDLDRLLGAIQGGDPAAITPAHSDFLQTLDIAITLSQIAVNGPGQ